MGVCDLVTPNKIDKDYKTLNSEKKQRLHKHGGTYSGPEAGGVRSKQPHPRTVQNQTQLHMGP